jgi:hypothetical protein
VKTLGTARFVSAGGFWAVQGRDGTTYEVAGGLDPAYRSEGLAVFIEAEIVTAVIPVLSPDVVISIHRIVAASPVP